MIAQFQKISFGVQNKINLRLRNILFFVLNAPYFYSYLLYRFKRVGIKNLVDNIKNRNIVLYTQNGFGDVFFTILLVEYLKNKYNNYSFSIAIHFSESSSDKNIVSRKISNKIILYGNYLNTLHYLLGSEYFHSFSGNCTTKGYLYCHIPFWRIFGYQNIISQSNNIFNKLNILFNSKNRGRYVTFYFRNDISKIFSVFEYFYLSILSNGFSIYVLGENVPKSDIVKMLQPGQSIYFCDDFTFVEKMELMCNSTFSITGRGGFALLPLFAKKSTFCFFDNQGLNEFNSGLWDYCLWENNIIKAPFFPSDNNYISIISNLTKNIWL